MPKTTTKKARNQSVATSPSVGCGCSCGTGCAKKHHGAIVGNLSDKEYQGYLKALNLLFLANCGQGSEPLFTTDVSNLWDRYLGSFADPIERQFHNCNSCRRFIERFGGLVTIDENGKTKSVMWDWASAPVGLVDAIRFMEESVNKAKVTGVFLSSLPIWGEPVTGPWRHMAVQPMKLMLWASKTQNAGQAMAEKKEDFKTVMTALGEFTPSHLQTALTLLESEALYRSEKVIGPAKWLQAVQNSFIRARGKAKANMVWKAVATAPAGFCHPRSSMIGTLLEDIAAGKSYDQVSRAFAAKMHPLQYQRPSAAPKAGAIKAAEVLVEKLNAEGSLERRFCRLDEVQALWRPTMERRIRKAPARSTGVFANITPKSNGNGSNGHQMVLPARIMCWEKFQRDILSQAERIEFQAPRNGNYTALVTAVHPEAPPILQWDDEENRNPVSWYVWMNGSQASQWGLTGGLYYDVAAVTLKPSMWNGGFEHQGSGVIFLIGAARETRMSGAALFPECLKAEFHDYRAVIEAYSRKAIIQGIGEPHAAGVLLDKSSANWNARVRVFSGGRSQDYVLDRWE